MVSTGSKYYSTDCFVQQFEIWVLLQTLAWIDELVR